LVESQSIRTKDNGVLRQRRLGLQDRTPFVLPRVLKMSAAMA